MLLYFIVLITLTFYTSEAAVVNIRTEFYFNCSKIIPDDPNSVIASIQATNIYTKDISCSNLNFTFNALFNLTINGTTTQTQFSIVSGSVIPQNGNKLYTSYGTIISGACTGASWGRVVPEPSRPLESCIAGNCKLNEYFSLQSWFAVIGGGCGFNLCAGTANSYIDPPLEG